MSIVYRSMRRSAILLAAFLTISYSAVSHSLDLTDKPNESKGAIETSELGFPLTQSWSINTSPINFEFTGESQRKLLFLRVYDIAHYVDSASDALTSHSILNDETNRQITIRYHHNIPAARVRSVLKDGFELNSTPEEWNQIEGKVEKFLAKIKRDAKPDDELVMRWLANNRVMFYLNKRLIAQTQHRLFARTLWSIWFGPHSVVKVGDLLSESRSTPGRTESIEVKPERAIAQLR